MKKIDYFDWIEKYKPMTNPDIDKTLIDFCWSNRANDEIVAKAVKESRIWTKLDCEAIDKHGDETMVIASGKHYVNRMEYYITEIPYTEEVEVL